MAHATARLTPAERLILVGRIAAQPRRPITHIAHEMGVSWTTAYRWWGRHQQLGQAGLVDRPSIPLRSPRRTAARLEERIVRLRRHQRLDPASIAARLGLPASTVHRVLVRHQLNRLAWLDRPTGRPIRRYEHDRPGNVLHLDVKKLGRIPAEGGHRVHGRATGTVNSRANRSAGGYDYLHAAVDDHSRLAYVEVLGDERAQSCARFWRRAHRWLALHGITVHRGLTDNGAGYRSRLFGAALADACVRHQRTRPSRPQTNGKVERFNRTLLEEWAYRRLYRSNTARDRAAQPWVHRYNHHRAHTALGGQPTISRVNNLPGYYNYQVQARCWTRRSAFALVRRGSNIHLLPYPLVVLRSSTAVANISGAILDPKDRCWGARLAGPAFTHPPHWLRTASASESAALRCPKQGGGHGRLRALHRLWASGTREGKQATEWFLKAMDYWENLQQRGEIESVEAVLLEPHGGGLSGFILVRGGRDKLASIRTSDEFVRRVIRAGLTVERFGVVGATIGRQILTLIGVYEKELGELDSSRPARPMTPAPAALGGPGAHQQSADRPDRPGARDQ
jgi:transposase InsO family protein